MVMIGTALQARLSDAAKRTLGPGGDSLIKETAKSVLNVPLDQATYAQLPTLFAALEREAPASAARPQAFAMSEALDRLRDDVEAGLSGRLIASVNKRLGPAAEPFLNNVCNRLGITLATVDRNHLVQVAEAVRQDATALLGADVAQTLAKAVLESGDARPPTLTQHMKDLARQHLGPDGEDHLRKICRERLEIDLEEINIEGISMLARAVAVDGPARLGAARAAAFVLALKSAIASPATELRAKILAMAKRQMGPAGEAFLKKACSKNGLPFDAVDYEHMMWLAEVLRADATPIVGKKNADELARGVRGFITGK